MSEDLSLERGFEHGPETRAYFENARVPLCSKKFHTLRYVGSDRYADRRKVKDKRAYRIV